MWVLLAACTDPPGRAAADDVAEAAAPALDVLIIGAGPAGLAAAGTALDQGATVLVLEREDDYGGSARWSGGLMLFSGSAEQEAIGVVDSPALLLADWAGFTGGDPADPWVAAFAENNVALVHDWLAELGVRWKEPVRDDACGSLPRVHNIDQGGPSLIDALEAPLPGETIRYEAEALELLRDTTGRVNGVRWLDRAHDVEEVTLAKTVIVATGGFLHDLERVRKERPDLADANLAYASWYGANGDGLAMVEAIGGVATNLGAIGLYAHGVPAPTGEQEEVMPSFMPRVPWINGLGARFVDESTLSSFATGKLRAEQGDVWAIFDAVAARTARFITGPAGSVELTFADMSAVTTTGDDLALLAGALDVDEAAFVSEIEAFDAFASGATEDSFRIDPSQANHVDAAPFYALPVVVSVAKGFGGVDVDTNGRVYDASGAVIPGLYAAGELTGMAGGTLVGSLGFTGSVTAVVLGGRIAGGAAADEGLAP